MKMTLIVRKNTLINVSFLIVGFLSVQRFSIDWYYLVPSVTIFFLIFSFRDTTKSSQILTICGVGLFLTVDNGLAYGETPSALRYFFYLSTIGTIIYINRTLSTKHLEVFLIYCIFLLLISLHSLTNLNLSNSQKTLISNLQVLFLLFIVFAFKNRAIFDCSLFFYASLGYLLGEVLNILFFYKDHIHYLSYDSLKCLVIFPALYASKFKFNMIAKLALWTIVIFVLFHYGSRMLLLSLIATTLLVYFMDFRLRNITMLGVFVFVLYLLSLIDISALIFNSSFGHLKGLNVIAHLYSYFKDSNLFEVLRTLDPVRYAEHQIAFDRPLWRILLGDGLGAGIYDENGILDFANGHASAFSKYEIQTSTYFNFHDIWIDFSVRFGLLISVIILIALWLDYLKNGDHFRTFLLIFCIINSTYSISGLIFTSLLALAFHPSNKSRATTSL